MSKWSESRIAAGVALGGLFKRSVLVVPNCNWTGYECDLLVIEKGLRIIDVEIKISRADLKADAKKDKWWHSRHWSRRSAGPRQWPDKVWKHYYVLPKEIWTPALLSAINSASGVILASFDDRFTGGLRMEVERNAKPCRDAKPITHVDAIDIARLASLRMWTAINKH